MFKLLSELTSNRNVIIIPSNVSLKAVARTGNRPPAAFAINLLYIVKLIKK